ncbi:MAG: hypothetical protein ABW220_00065 [Burkholderiaceae bacterium]
MKDFLDLLKEQRWDDHRYYHHCRINQSLHLLSACCFVIAYGLLLIEPAWAALLAWGVSMTSRQAGHFFFEPKGYDEVNQATHQHKEDIKVGYNLRRKVVLMGLWAASPVLLWLQPGLFGLFPAADSFAGYLHQLGLVWLAIGAAGLVVRVLQLAVTRDLRTGLAWAFKIITDPFHDIQLYHRAPLHLLRGERMDPMLWSRDGRQNAVHGEQAARPG